jgi:hypothetical protein
MDPITANQNQLLQEGLILREDQLLKQKAPKDRLVANTIGKSKQLGNQRTLLEDLSKVQHTPDIAVPSDINPDLYHKPKTPKNETSRTGSGFGNNKPSSKNKNHTRKPAITQLEAPSNFPASQSPSYPEHLNKISIQRDYSTENNTILHIENSETIKSNIEANRRLLWRTLVQNPELQSLAKDTLAEYLNARPDTDKLIEFTFPPENGQQRRVKKKVTPGNIRELENDPDIQMSVLLAKAKTDPDKKITEGLNLKNILQIINHMAYISAWKDDSKTAKYPADEPELRQILDLSIRSTQALELEAEELQKLEEVFRGEIITVLSPEILEEKTDSNGNKYEVVIPLEEMFKKPSIINPDNLIKIAEAFKNLSGLDLAKDKSLDIFSVPVNPDQPQWPNLTDIRRYTKDGSLAHIAYMEPRLSNTKRPGNVHHEQEEGEVLNDQQHNPVNNHTSTVVNETVLDAQNLLSDLFNPSLPNHDSSLPKACSNFETQYPTIAKNPLMLINNDKYCNSGVIQYLCFNNRFGEASEAFKHAMPKLTNEEDKKFLETVILTQSTYCDDIKIKLCALPQILSWVTSSKHETSPVTVNIPPVIKCYLENLNKLLEQKPELSKELLEYMDQMPRKGHQNDILELGVLIYRKLNEKLFNDDFLEWLKWHQSKIVHESINQDLERVHGDLKKDPYKQFSLTVPAPTIPGDPLLLKRTGESLKDIKILSLYTKGTITNRIKNGEAFTLEEIHKSAKDYYEQGDKYKLK